MGNRGSVRIDCGGKAGRYAVHADWPDGLSGQERQISECGTGIELPFTAVRRGSWTMPDLWLGWSTPWRLFQRVQVLRGAREIAVVPDIRPLQSGEISVRVRSELFGVKENSLIGEGSEFHQLRDFVPGMDVRSIDWKRSARHRGLLAKEMRAERNHHIVLCVDAGRLMREEIAGLPKVDHAVNAALALAWAGAIGGDLVGFFSYDARPRIYLPPVQGRGGFARIRSRSADVAYASVEANHTLAFAELGARTPRRSLLVVFTDFTDPTTAGLLVENLGVLARRHAIIFVALRNPDDEPPIGTAPASLDAVAATVVRSERATERHRVMDSLRRIGLTVLDCAPGKVTPRLIAAYLELKARDVI
ncbi:MAG: DUF58 domain-containing protein [Pseudomonadota bacterium]